MSSTSHPKPNDEGEGHPWVLHPTPHSIMPVSLKLGLQESIEAWHLLWTGWSPLGQKIFRMFFLCYKMYHSFPLWPRRVQLIPWTPRQQGILLKANLYPEASPVSLRLARLFSHRGLRCFCSSCDHDPGASWAGGHLPRSLEVHAQPNVRSCVKPLAKVGQHCLVLRIRELFQGGLIKDSPYAGKLLLEGPPAPALALSSAAWSLLLDAGYLDTQAMRFGPLEAKRESVTPPWSFGPGKEPSHPGGSWERGV